MAILGSTLFALIGAVIVVGFGVILRRRLLRRASLPSALATSHATIVVISIALYPIRVLCASAPFDDVYLPFMLVPGIHIYWLGYWLGRCIDLAFHSQLLAMLSFHSVSVLVLVVIPGIICLLVGTLQWYLLGHLWQRLRSNKSAAGNSHRAYQLTDL